MTQTYLVTYGTVGTQPVQASSEAEALTIAQRYLGAHAWRVVKAMPPSAPWTPPTYDADHARQRDPLDSGE